MCDPIIKCRSCHNRSVELHNRRLRVAMIPQCLMPRLISEDRDDAKPLDVVAVALGQPLQNMELIDPFRFGAAQY